jgi:hypothetical protein
MLNQRRTTRSISTKDGQVIAPLTKIDVMPWPADGWRIAFLVEDRDRIVTLSDDDLKSHSEPS